jgi:hypothetical protein
MPWRRSANASNGTPDHDVTVRSGTEDGPAPINIGDGSERRMRAIGETASLRDNMETVNLSLDIVGNPGRLEDIHPDPARSQPLHPHGGGTEAGGLSPHCVCQPKTAPL